MKPYGIDWSTAIDLHIKPLSWWAEHLDVTRASVGSARKRHVGFFSRRYHVEILGKCLVSRRGIKRNQAFVPEYSAAFRELLDAGLLRDEQGHLVLSGRGRSLAERVDVRVKAGLPVCVGDCIHADGGGEPFVRL